MPVVNRKALRKELGRTYLKAETIGTSALAVAAGSFVCVMDPNLANPDFSGQNLYVRSWLRAGSVDYRIGSFNVASGAFVSAQLARNALPSGGDFEIYDRWSASELDECIDLTVDEIRVNREVTFPGRDKANFYAIDSVASPHTITDMNDVYFYASADSTVNRQRGSFSNVNWIATATGTEVRVSGYTTGSVQIAIDAILKQTLGAADDATILIPDKSWILWGAQARAYQLLAQRTPGQDNKYILERRAEAARAFSAKSALLAPYVSRRVSLQSPDTKDRFAFDPFGY